MNQIVRRSGVVCAEVDGEVVALNIERGVCYGLDSIGSCVWGLIEQPISFHALCAALIARYRVEPAICARDVGDLLRELEVEDLVDLGPASAPSAS